jgi:hypothetical protein
MAVKKPARTFNGAEGAASTGNAGPTGLKNDIDALCKMFDPAATHGTGEPGGIQVGNIATDSIGNTGGAGDANKIVQFKADGSLPGNISSAANVTNQINGHNISNIFEVDGETVKEATHADSADSATNATTAANATASGGVRVIKSGYLAGGTGTDEIALPDFTIAAGKVAVVRVTLIGNVTIGRSDPAKTLKILGTSGGIYSNGIDLKMYGYINGIDHLTEGSYSGISATIYHSIMAVFTYTDGTTGTNSAIIPCYYEVLEVPA